MEANKILKSELIDILFENRNKSYGAYVIRKEYDIRLIQSLSIILLSVMAIALYFGFAKEVKIKPERFIAETILYKIPPKEMIKKKNEVVAVPQKKSGIKRNSQMYISKIKIVDSTETATKLSKNLDSTSISNITQIGKPGVVPVATIINGLDSNNITKIPSNNLDINTPRKVADIMPAFPGGMSALRRFLENNLINPSEQNQSADVNVKIEFVVGYDGKLKGFDIVEDGGDIFNNEVIRVLKKMPNWIPGKSNGENVSVYYSIPVKFNTSNE